MKKKLLASLLMLVMLLTCFDGTVITAFAADTATVSYTVTYCQTDTRSELDMINDFRTGDEAWYWNSDDSTKTVCSGLSELTYDYELEKIAMQRCAEIAISYSHTRPDGSTYRTAYSDYGYSYSTIGENIAAGYKSASAVFEGWREDDENYSGQGHRRNMLSSSFDRVGCAGLYFNGTYYWVQEFAKSTVSNSSTSANDSDTTVSADIDLSDTTTTLTCGSDSITAGIDETTDIPDITVAITMTNSWPSTAKPVTADLSYSIADTSVAAVSGSGIKGIKKGSTTLTVTALNGSLEIPVTVQCNHSYTSEVTKEPTCTSTGTRTYTCSKCGDSYTESIAMTDHTYKSTVTEATCTDQGYTAYTCSVCGDSYKDNYTDALGHDYTLTSSSQTSCDKEGTATYTCSRCGAEKTETIAAGTHSWDNGTVTTEATCSLEGVKTYTCSKCGATKTETIAKTDHNYQKKVTEATCTEQGYTTCTCSVCGDSYKEDYTDALGHDYELTSTDRNSCDEEGTATYTCSRCGATKTETLAAGSHSWDNGTVTKEATCTSEGTKTYTCQTCGATKTESIAKLSHSYTSTVTGATCTEQGYTTYTCSKCGDTYKDSYTDALGHDYELTSTSRTSCDEEGTATYTCSRCGVTKTETLAAGTHTWDNGTVTKEPTETETGIRTYTCQTCGKTKTETIPVISPEPEPEPEPEPGKSSITSFKNMSDGVKITFTEVEDADYYYVYRKTADGSYKKLGTVSAGSNVYTDTTAYNGKMYTYKVNAYIGSVKSSGIASSWTWLAPVTITSTKTVTDNARQIIWSANKKADYYTVYRSTDNGSYKKVATVSGGSSHSWTDKSATDKSAKYKYKIYAYKKVSGTAYKSYPCTPVRAYYMAKTAIISYKNAGSGRADLRWKKISTAEYYEIQISTNKSFSDPTTFTVDPSYEQWVTIGGMTKGSTYYVRIRAMRYSGDAACYASWCTVKSLKISK